MINSFRAVFDPCRDNEELVKHCSYGEELYAEAMKTISIGSSVFELEQISDLAKVWAAHRMIHWDYDTMQSFGDAVFDAIDRLIDETEAQANNEAN